MCAFAGGLFLGRFIGVPVAIDARDKEARVAEVSA